MTSPLLQKQMWRACRAVAICALFAHSTTTLVGHFFAPKIVAHCATAWVLVAAMLTILLRRRSLSLAAGACLFLSIGLIHFTTVILNTQEFVRLGQLGNPFVGEKIIALVVALVAPPLPWLGFFPIALAGLIPIAEYYTWGESVRRGVGLQEPWVTTIFAACAAVVYVYRLRFAELARREAAAEARAQELRRFAHLLLGAQHLSNTPLQTIELATEIVSEQSVESRDCSFAIKRALDIIRRVNRVLSFGENQVEWNELVLPANVEELEEAAQRLRVQTTPLAPS